MTPRERDFLTALDLLMQARAKVRPWRDDLTPTIDLAYNMIQDAMQAEGQR